MIVLDVGCGTGSITAGIAKAVGPHGHVVGIDRDEVLLELARKEHAGATNLRFKCGDATALPRMERFDVVSSARTLQWISNPALAVENMKQALRPSGTLVVLDYNHADNSWEPAPPPAFMLFYDAFLAWRSKNHWDNRIADQLPALFRSAGLVEVGSRVQDEVAERGNPDFIERAALWSEVIENVGEQISASRFCTKRQIESARESYRLWAGATMVRQTLALKAVIGVAQ
jgi:SAM-dependent methyltransferase